MKRIAGTVLLIALTLSMLAGCSQSTGTKKKVGIIQLMDHTSLNTIKNAFDKEMEKLGYNDKNIEYSFKNGNGDTNTLASIANDPIGAKLTSSLTHPNKNMTGTSDEVQVDQILEKALEVQPKLKKIGFLYNKGEANSVTNIKNAKAYLLKKNIQVEEAAVSSVNEVQSAVNVLSSKCEAIFSPNDNTVASAMAAAGKAAIKAKIPFYTGADSMVKDGGFLTVGIDYEELGKETARMTDQILKGKKISELPVKVFKTDLNIYVNKKTADALEIKLPESIIQNKKYKEL